MSDRGAEGIAAMGLTDEERRRLDALADDLAREDPRLGQVLSGATLRRRLLGSPAVLVSLIVTVSLLLGIVGVSLDQPLVFAAGSVMLTAAIWFGLAVGRRFFRRGRR